MDRFLTEFVGVPEDRCLIASSPVKVREVLEEMCRICFGMFGVVDGFDRAPGGEFSFRARKPEDRIFRVRDFERGRTIEEVKPVEGQTTKHDGGPGCSGLDLLGKYTFHDSTVTIYVDSCRRVEQEYGDGSWILENLIDIVLTHELAHLVTDRGFTWSDKQSESDHFWEYTAQCATYAFLKQMNNLDSLKVFELLSPHQPFIYRTWEGLKLFDGCEEESKKISDTVRQIFCASAPAKFSVWNKE